MPSIARDRSVKGVEYFHILLENHEIIYAEGAPCETLAKGKDALANLTQEQFDEIQSIFPEVLSDQFQEKFARKVPNGKQQKKLLAQICQNQNELYEHTHFFR